MADWANAVRDALDDVETGLADLMGVGRDVSPEAFEKAVGDLLAWERMADDLLPFFRLGRVDAAVEHPHDLSWLQRAVGRFDLAKDALISTIFRLFPVDAVDARTAATVLEQLLRELEVDPVGTAFAIATTNFDLVHEASLEALGANTADGWTAVECTREQWAPTGSPPFLERRRTTTETKTPCWSSSHVPVLHLHGSLAWRWNDGELAKVVETSQYDSQARQLAPAIQIPDPDKEPQGVFRDHWQWFYELLATASHVVVIGHSLNDRPVVRAVRQSQVKVAVVNPALDENTIRRVLMGHDLGTRIDLGTWFEALRLRKVGALKGSAGVHSQGGRSWTYVLRAPSQVHALRVVKARFEPGADLRGLRTWTRY
jgi:hypothetical protein